MTLAEMLVLDEGKKSTVYTDTMGKLTIGVGRNLTDVGINSVEKATLGIPDVPYDQLNLTDQQIMGLLQFDIQKHAKQCEIFPWFKSLNCPRQDAIVNMHFNLGSGGVAQFHNMLECIAKGDFCGAAQEMLNSKWHIQVKDRAVRLARIIETGQYL